MYTYCRKRVKTFSSTVKSRSRDDIEIHGYTEDGDFCRIGHAFDLRAVRCE